MPLSAVAPRSAKPKDKAYRLSDEKGLYLEVTPAGGRYWRMKYRMNGKEKRLALGVYPDVSLSDAREARDQARKLLTQGIDPSEAKQEAKAVKKLAAATSFEAVAREWHSKFLPTWAPLTGARILQRLEADVFPTIGRKPIAEITAPVLLECLRKIEARGVTYTAHKARQYAGQIFRYAVATHTEAGFSSLDSIGGRTDNRRKAVFFRPQHGKPPYGRAVWEGFGPAGSYARSANPPSPPTLV